MNRIRWPLAITLVGTFTSPAGLLLLSLTGALLGFAVGLFLQTPEPTASPSSAPAKAGQPKIIPLPLDGFAQWCGDDGRYLLVTNRKAAALVNILTGESVTVKAQVDVENPACSVDGALVRYREWSSSSSINVRELDFRTQTEQLIWQLVAFQRSAADSFILSPDGVLVATNSFSGSIAEQDGRPAPRLVRVPGLPRNFSTSGRWVGSMTPGPPTDRVHIIDTGTGQQTTAYLPTTNSVGDIALDESTSQAFVEVETWERGNGYAVYACPFAGGSCRLALHDLYDMSMNTKGDIAFSRGIFGPEEPLPEGVIDDVSPTPISMSAFVLPAGSRKLANRPIPIGIAPNPEISPSGDHVIYRPAECPPSAGKSCIAIHPVQGR